jgi:acetylornithine/succinyldiaminopimelate/putrescine aminotransferase
LYNSANIYKKVTGKGLVDRSCISKHLNSATRLLLELFKRGVLVAGTLTSAQTVRIEPPLVVTTGQMDALAGSRLGDTLREINSNLVIQCF